MTESTATQTVGGSPQSLVTTYHYDARGLQTQTDGSSTQVLYDA